MESTDQAEEVRGIAVQRGIILTNLPESEASGQALKELGKGLADLLNSQAVD